jgi:hypothetical protein
VNIDCTVSTLLETRGKLVLLSYMNRQSRERYQAGELDAGQRVVLGKQERKD